MVNMNVNVLIGYRGRIFWYRSSLLPACARMTSICFIVYPEGGKSLFRRQKNENVSVSPLT